MILMRLVDDSESSLLPIDLRRVLRGAGFSRLMLLIRLVNDSDSVVRSGTKKIALYFRFFLLLISSAGAVTNFVNLVFNFPR